MGFPLPDTVFPICKSSFIFIPGAASYTSCEGSLLGGTLKSIRGLLPSGLGLEHSSLSYSLLLVQKISVVFCSCQKFEMLLSPVPSPGKFNFPAVAMSLWLSLQLIQPA